MEKLTRRSPFFANKAMGHYDEILHAIYRYFEDMLMGESALTWDHYAAKVGNRMGPYDKDLWELFIEVEKYKISSMVNSKTEMR